MQGKVIVTMYQNQKDFVTELSEGDILGDFGVLQNMPKQAMPKQLVAPNFYA